MSDTVPTFQEMYPDIVYGGDVDSGMSDVYGLNDYYPDPSADILSPEEYESLYGEAPDDYYYGLTGQTEDPSMWGQIGSGLASAGRGALEWLGGSSNNGQSQNWQDLLNAGFGAAGMYGAWQNNQNKNELSQAALDLQRELGVGKLEFDRDRSGISDTDSMAKMAMLSNIWANEGRVSPDQSNPMLNFMMTARQGLWQDDDQFGKAYAANPFGASPLGAPVTRAEGYGQQMGRPQTNRMMGFAEGGAVPRMGMRARLNQMRAERMPVQQNVLKATPNQGMRARLNQMYAERAKQPSMAMGQSLQGGALGGFGAGMGQGMQNGALGGFNGALGSVFNRAPSNMMGQYALPGMYAGGNQQLNQSNANKLIDPQQFTDALAAMGAKQGMMQQAPSNQIGDLQSMVQAKQGMMQQMPGALSNLMGNYNRKAFEAPQQYAHGGLSFLNGASGGQADNVNASLSHGEYVLDADVVSALGDGNTEAGAQRLDEMRERIRQHKRSAPNNKIPPVAKDPMAYLGRK